MAALDHRPWLALRGRQDDFSFPREIRLAPESSKLVIGRQTDNDVILPYKWISRKHCQLEVDEKQKCILTSLSTNGMIVNSILLLQGSAKELEDLDEIEFVAPPHVSRILYVFHPCSGQLTLEVPAAEMEQRNENETDEQKQSPRAEGGSDLEAKNDALIHMSKGTSTPDAKRALLDVKNLEGKLSIATTPAQFQDHDYCVKSGKALQQDDPAGGQNPLNVSASSEVAESSVNPGGHGNCSKISEQEKSMEKVNVGSDVESPRRSMERMLGGASDWERKVKFLSYLGMVLKSSRRPSYEGPRLPYHWRYNLRVRESSLGNSADEKPTLKSDAGSSGNRRRRRNKTSVKGDDSKKVVMVAGLKDTTRHSRQAKNDKRAPHWSYNLRGLNVVNYKEAKRASVATASIVAPIKRKASGYSARRLNPVGRKEPRSEVKGKQGVLRAKNRAKNKEVGRERSGKKTTKTSGQSADEPCPAKRPKKSAAKSSQNQVAFVADCNHRPGEASWCNKVGFLNAITAVKTPSHIPDTSWASSNFKSSQCNKTTLMNETAEKRCS